MKKPECDFFGEICLMSMQGITSIILVQQLNALIGVCNWHV